jgi:hypothetical protein
MTGTKKYWRKRSDLVFERDRKLKTILSLTREKVLKEGWHSCTMRGVIRLLRQHNLNHSYYIPTKLALGLALAEQEYALLVKIFRDERKKQYSPRQTLTNCTQLMMFHFTHCQNLLDIWLDRDIISEYNNLAQSRDNQRVELTNTRQQFLQEIFAMLYQLTQDSQVTNTDNKQHNPYFLLNAWLYHFIGMSRLGLYRDLKWNEQNIATSLSLLIPDKNFGVTL